MTDDIVQEVFLSLYQTLNEKRIIRNPRAFLYQVSANHIKNQYRSRRYQREKIQKIHTEPERLQASRPELEWEHREFLDYINDRISEMEEPYKSIIYLLDIQEKSYKKVEEILGISERTLRRKREEAKRMLAQSLKALNTNFPICN